jgi:hypothetical protein
MRFPFLDAVIPHPEPALLTGCPALFASLAGVSYGLVA